MTVKHRGGGDAGGIAVETRGHVRLIGLNRPEKYNTLRPELLDELDEALRAANEALWDIEDRIRGCEAAGDFGAEFVALARAVYRTNDRRAALKREISLALGSRLIEEKSYKPY